jgi:hypothetical protein
VLNNIETKVIAAAAGAGGGGAVSGFLLWLLGVTVWGVPKDADHATQAVAAVPMPVALLLAVALAVIGAALGGYRAPHTDRPDLAGTSPLAGLFDNPTPPQVPVSVPAVGGADVPLSPGDVTSRAAGSGGVAASAASSPSSSSPAPAPAPAVAAPAVPAPSAPAVPSVPVVPPAATS